MPKKTMKKDEAKPFYRGTVNGILSDEDVCRVAFSDAVRVNPDGTTEKLSLTAIFTGKDAGVFEKFAKQKSVNGKQIEFQYNRDNEGFTHLKALHT